MPWWLSGLGIPIHPTAKLLTVRAGLGRLKAQKEAGKEREIEVDETVSTEQLLIDHNNAAWLALSLGKCLVFQDTKEIQSNTGRSTKTNFSHTVLIFNLLTKEVVHTF